MEKSIDRRGALKYMGAAAIATSFSASKAWGAEKEAVHYEGGWQFKDEGYEKHIPVVSVKQEGDVAAITVEVKHPQEKDHHISTFKIYDEDRIELTRCDLHPEMSTPKAVFYLRVKSGSELIATSDCNQHGIWMKRFKV